MSFSYAKSQVLVGFLLLTGCAGSGNFSLFPGIASTEASPATEAGACPTPEACAVQLKKLVDDPRRDWIGQPQSADAYANGTRLFAYRALRKKLTCNELKRALEDTVAAASSLQSPRHDRARVLTTAVSQELKAEQSRRCHPRL